MSAPLHPCRHAGRLAFTVGALDIRTELERFTYIGHDDELAVARVRYRTVGDTSEPFMNHILETITVFHSR